jgi:hypothetical protein
MARLRRLGSIGEGSHDATEHEATKGNAWRRAGIAGVAREWP